MLPKQDFKINIFHNKKALTCIFMLIALMFCLHTNASASSFLDKAKSALGFGSSPESASTESKIPEEEEIDPNTPEETIKAIATAIEEKPEDFFKYVDIKNLKIIPDKDREQIIPMVIALPDILKRTPSNVQFTNQLLEKLDKEFRPDKRLTSLLKDGSLANAARKIKSIELPWVPEWLLAAKIEIIEDEKDLAIATIILPDGLQVLLGMTTKNGVWQVVGIEQNKVLAIKAAKFARSLYTARELNGQLMAKQKERQTEALKALEGYKERLKALIDKWDVFQDINPFIYMNAFSSRHAIITKNLEELSKITSEDEFWEDIEARLVKTTLTWAKKTPQRQFDSLSDGSSPLAYLSGALDNDSLEIVYDKSDLLILRITHPAPDQVFAKEMNYYDTKDTYTYYAFIKNEDKWQHIMKAMTISPEYSAKDKSTSNEAESQQLLKTTLGSIKVDGLPDEAVDFIVEFADLLPDLAEKAEEKLAELKAAAEKQNIATTKEISIFASTLAELLKKNDKKAFLDNMDTFALAINPESKNIPEQINIISKQLAPGAALRRAILNNDAKAEQQKSLILSLTPENLLKAKYAPENNSTVFGTISLPASDKIPALVLGIHKIANKWQIISATSKIINVEDISTALNRVKKVEKAKDSPARKTFMGLAEALHAKDGEKIAKYLNIPIMEYYAKNENREHLAYWLTYTDEMDKKKASIIKEMKNTGILTLGKYSINAQELEASTLGNNENLSWLVFPDNKTYLIIHKKHQDSIMGITNDKYFNSDFKNWPLDDDYTKKYVDEYMTEAAIKSINMAVLDNIKFIDIKYQVIQKDGRLKWYIDALVQNTLKSTISFDYVDFYILDKDGEVLYTWQESTRKEILPMPNATKISWPYNTNGKEILFLQYIAEHGGKLVIKAQRAKYNGKSFSRTSSSNFQVEKTDAGLWKSAALPFISPIKLTPNLRQEDVSKNSEVQNFISQSKAKQAADAAAFAKKIFDSIDCQVSLIKKDKRNYLNYVLNTHFDTPLEVRYVNLHIMDLSNAQQPITVATLSTSLSKDVSSTKETTVLPRLYDDDFRKFQNYKKAGYTMQCAASEIRWNDLRFKEDGKGLLIDGILTPWIKGNPLVLSYSEKNAKAKEQAKSAKAAEKAKNVTAKPATPAKSDESAKPATPAKSDESAKAKAETAKPSESAKAKAEPAKAAESAKAKTEPAKPATPVAADTAKTTPVASATGAPAPSDKAAPITAAGKTPGKAVLVALASKHDYVGAKEFAPDKKPDTRMQVVYTAPNAEIVSIRIDTLGRGTKGRWQNNTAKGGMPLIVYQNGKALNTKSSDFKLKADKAMILDLFFQDNGAIAAGKNKLRIAFVLSDGKRGYSVFDPAAK